MPATDSSRKRRRAPIRALVVSCSRVDGYKGDIWQGRHAVDVLLTCGHLIRKVTYRRFLTGEKIVCSACTRARLVDPVLPGIFPTGVP